MGETYISVDVETDGPIPGEFSMLAVGACVAGSRTDSGYARSCETQSFELELKPISERFDPEALAVSGLDREALVTTGEDPREAMTRFSNWIHAITKGTPIFVSYPLGFDWMWTQYYFHRFLGESPFRHSHGLDLRTLFSTKSKRPFAASGRSQIPKSLRPASLHTHRAIDDAISQAELFSNLMEWQT